MTRQFIILALVTVTAVVLLWAYTERKLLEERTSHQRLEVSSHSNHLAGRLAAEITSDLHLLTGLMAEVAYNPEISDERFARFASEVVRNHDRVMNVALGQDFTITKIHPLEGNRPALGLDLRTMPDQHAALQRMMQNQGIVISGPHDLVQGGTGIIGRLPVMAHADVTESGQEEIWGFASLVINYPQLLRDVGIENYEQNMDIAIRGRDGLGSEGEVFYGRGALFNENAVITPVDLPNGSWLIAARPRGGWAGQPENADLVRAGFALFALLLLILIYYSLQRTRDKQRLVMALAEANEANEAKSRFLAMMSHDLRTPLNAILGFSDIIRKETLGRLENKQYAEYAELINKSGQQLLQSVNNLLDLARLERNALVPRKTQVDLKPLIELVISQNQQAAEARNITLDSKTDENCSFLFADQEMLSRMITNLISNAIKFSDKGSSISIRCIRNDAGQMEISVADTGLGMTAEEIEMACEPFVQFDSLWSRREDGSALGLSIVRSFADLHGAELDIQSEKGKGTVITLRFPTERTPAPDAATRV